MLWRLCFRVRCLTVSEPYRVIVYQHNRLSSCQGGRKVNGFLAASARTPIGAFQGGLSRVTAPDLRAAAMVAVCERSGIPAENVDEVIMGNVISAGVVQAPARQAALRAGLPNTMAAVTINKVRCSGSKAVMLASQAIRTSQRPRRWNFTWPSDRGSGVVDLDVIDEANRSESRSRQPMPGRRQAVSLIVDGYREGI